MASGASVDEMKQRMKELQAQVLTCVTGTNVLAYWYKSTCVLVQKYKILTPEKRHS
jgi:hypothetical protein